MTARLAWWSASEVWLLTTAALNPGEGSYAIEVAAHQGARQCGSAQSLGRFSAPKTSAKRWRSFCSSSVKIGCGVGVMAWTVACCAIAFIMPGWERLFSASRSDALRARTALMRDT